MRYYILIFVVFLYSCSYTPIAVRDDFRVPDNKDKSAWSRAHGIIAQERGYYFSDDYIINFTGSCTGINDEDVLDYNGRIIREYSDRGYKYIILIESAKENQLPQGDDNRNYYKKFFQGAAYKIKTYILGNE